VEWKEGESAEEVEREREREIGKRREAGDAARGE
jgi:hypothetical protein